MKVETQQVVTFDDGSALIVPQHVEQFVREALMRGKAHATAEIYGGIHIHAIKFMRAEFGLSLKNAKDLVDYWRGNYTQPDTMTLGQLMRDKLDRQGLNTSSAA